LAGAAIAGYGYHAVVGRAGPVVPLEETTEA
jgi:hypothetical protein